MKSQHSNPNGACVDVIKNQDGTVTVRHSKCLDDPGIIYTQAEWEAFTAGVKDGEFDFATMPAGV